jgi:predicted nucleic acid-binding protein
LVVTDWLIDKSALVRLADAADPHVWLNRFQQALVRIATPTLLEVGYSARSGDDWRRLTAGAPVSWLPVQYVTPRAEQRALQVQGELASRGHHRAPSIPDLLVAAIAEDAGLTVLHVDKDYDLIAEVTGQPTERLTLT